MSGANNVEYRASGREGWRARLRIDYRRDGARSVARDVHEGPLRVLRALYPEGEGVCHHVLVHPPGGVAGGDALDIDLRLGAGTHALVTTPGATRFYRGGGRHAAQRAALRVGEGARLEWLPLESIAYPGCDAANVVSLELAAGAQMIGWDVIALGLPESGAPFDAGCFVQELCWPGCWLERGRIDAGDRVLLDGPLGLAGERALATMWFAGAPEDAQADALVDAARAALAVTPLAARSGVTRPRPGSGLVVVRALAPRVEPLMQALVRVRAAWRMQAWGLAAEPPRVWRT